MRATSSGCPANFTYNAQMEGQIGEQLSLPGFTSPSLRGVSRGVGKHRLPTNTTTRQHRVHRWFNFIAGFSPEFVSECWEASHLGPNDQLLDPFAGCGTAPLSACQHGGSAVGFEPHPVFARIARAKLLGQATPGRIAQIRDIILTGLSAPVSLDALGEAPRRFLEKLFETQVLEQLLGAKHALVSSILGNDDLAFLMLSRVVEKSTHSQTDGIYKAPTTRRRASDPTDACFDTAAMLHADVSEMNHPDYSARARLVQESSEDMDAVASGCISVVVTSPPYLNNFDYAEMTRMLLYFWSIADCWGEITTKVRSKLITNTTTALKGQRELIPRYRENVPAVLHEELDELVAQLAHLRADRAGKKEYDALVYPYFGQMVSVLRECRRCLKTGGLMHIMIADAALYGVHIPTPQLIASMLTLIGLQEVTCKLIRPRGHRWVLAKREGSPAGLGEYHVKAKKA